MRKSPFCLLAWLFSFSVLSEESLQPIRVLHDPFQKPAILQKSPVESEAPEQEVWVPKLTATLRAGRNSMANVNGKILKLGETFNGYKLLKVDARSAVFVKNKQLIHLKIDDERKK